MNILFMGLGGAVFFLIAAVINAAVIHYRKKRIDVMIKNEYEE